jgi:inner membrane protein
MPSPLGHSLAGYIIHQATDSRVARNGWQLLVLYILVANSPDLDFIPGFFIGEPNRYHHGISHSIGFALAFSVGLSTLRFFLRRDRFWRKLGIFFLLYSSHLGLDYLSTDTSPPHGQPLFWPLSSTYYIAPITLFPDIRRVSNSVGDFVVSLACLHNLWAACLEFLLLFPLLLIVQALRRSAKDSAC